MCLCALARLPLLLHLPQELGHRDAPVRVHALRGVGRACGVHRDTAAHEGLPVRGGAHPAHTRCLSKAFSLRRLGAAVGGGPLGKPRQAVESLFRGPHTICGVRACCGKGLAGSFEEMVGDFPDVKHATWML